MLRTTRARYVPRIMPVAQRVSAVIPSYNHDRRNAPRMKKCLERVFDRFFAEHWQRASSRLDVRA